MFSMCSGCDHLSEDRKSCKEGVSFSEGPIFASICGLRETNLSVPKLVVRAEGPVLLSDRFTTVEGNSIVATTTFNGILYVATERRLYELINGSLNPVPFREVLGEPTLEEKT